MFATRRCSRLRFHTLSERADGVNVFSVEVVYMIWGFGDLGGVPPQRVSCPQLHHVVQHC